VTPRHVRAEDFAPGTFADHGDGHFSLTYSSFPPFDDLCTAEGMQDRGTFWQALVIAVLEDDEGAEVLESLDFDSNPTSFSASSDDPRALREVAKALRKLEDRDTVAELVDKLDLRQYE
jgi:hypothetical protein